MVLLFVVDLTARAFTSVFSAVVVGVAVDFSDVPLLIFWDLTFYFLMGIVTVTCLNCGWRA